MSVWCAGRTDAGLHGHAGWRGTVCCTNPWVFGWASLTQHGGLHNAWQRCVRFRVRGPARMDRQRSIVYIRLTHCAARAMPDIYSPKKRSEVMSCVRATGTKPELVVRQLAHRMGYRFRLHHRRMPGRPDIVFPRHRKVIFVHGCFWHGHQGCSKATIPITNREFWIRKLTRNRERDQENLNSLHQSGWKTLVVWECETQDKRRLSSQIRRFFEAGIQDEI